MKQNVSWTHSRPAFSASKVVVRATGGARTTTLPRRSKPRSLAPLSSAEAGERGADITVDYQHLYITVRRAGAAEIDLTPEKLSEIDDASPHGVATGDHNTPEGLAADRL
ncbi:hypothetical protein AB6V29_09200 [Microbacterium sp. 20-116]|uniref:hypothetical protein n=1 Tax=Microbacterium sp. 20-116 TaxID=3239883 RepID=UPI0034E1E886